MKKTPKNPTKTGRKKAGRRAPTVKPPTKLASDIVGLHKPQEYLEFITFMAIPEVLREDLIGARTHGDFSKKYRVDEDTLTSWKKRVGFWDDVVATRKDFFKARTANVLLALETKSLDPNKVNGQDVRVLLTYTGEYSEKAETEHKIHPELAAALDKIGKMLPE